MNQELTQEFMAEEVEIALKQMAALKSSGSDSMSPLFYQNYWSLVGSDVIETILYLNLGTLPDLLCHFFITLIPKVKNPEFIFQYHRICLSNVLTRSENLSP